MRYNMIMFFIFNLINDQDIVSFTGSLHNH